MPRRNALQRINAQDPIAGIPLATAKARKREWDKRNPVKPYYVPADLHDAAKDVKATIAALSYQHMATAGSVANALATYSLAMIRKGVFQLEARPDAARKKGVVLTWVETEGWPRDEELPPAPKTVKRTDKDLYVGFRWSRDVDTQIRALASDGAPVGEVVVTLLQYALDAHKNGRFTLEPEGQRVSQKVSATW
jgi:hypothetical protein